MRALNLLPVSFILASAFVSPLVILEACNPQRAVRVLTGNLGMNTALPCRISIYQEGGRPRSA